MDNSAPPKYGTKIVSRMTTALILLQTVAILLLFYLAYTNKLIPPRLFQAMVPQRVLTPVVSLGAGFVRIEATKCNLTDDILLVGGITNWIREEPSYRRIEAGSTPLERGNAFPSGCLTRVYENAFPVQVEAGVWHIQGLNFVRDTDGTEQTVPWYTEKFTITEVRE